MTLVLVFAMVFVFFVISCGLNLSIVWKHLNRKEKLALLSIVAIEAVLTIIIIWRIK